MNNIFNFQRFLKLLGKHTSEHYKTYLISTAVMVGILALMMGFTAYVNGGSLGINVQGAYFFIFLFLSGTIFTSMVFADLGDKKKSIPMLTLPVSHFERFLVGWVYSYVIFQLVFVACFFTIDFMVINVGNMNPKIHNELISTVDDRDKFLIAFLIFGLLHATTFLGAIFFEKLHFIKTAFVFFISLIIVEVVNMPIVSFFFKTSSRFQPLFSEVSFTENKSIFHVDPSDQAYNVVIFMFITLTVVLWAATFFKMKEKQV